MPNVVLPIGANGKVVPLPPLCIRCGQPATRKLKMQFSNDPTNDEGKVASVPLCDSHPFMGQFMWIILGGLGVIAICCVVGMILKPFIHHYVVAFPLIAIVIVIALFATYVTFTSIGCKEVDEDGVTITGASPQFIRALEKQEWTHEKVAAAMRKNRKGREKPEDPLWFSPYFYVPVGVGLCFLLFAPVGFLMALREPTGTWPAGQPANPPQQQTVAPAPGNNPPVVNNPVPNNPVVNKPGGDNPGLVNNKPEVKQQPEALNPRSLPGLIGYWALDDGQGGAAQDSSGHGILALLNGGKWVKGIRGTAVEFNGTSDFLDLGPADNRLTFAAGAPFTIACWVSTTAEAGVISSFRRRSSPNPVVDLAIREGKAHGWVRDDTSKTGGAIAVGGTINDGKWHHVALVRKTDGTIEIYVDAKLQASDRGKNSGGPLTTDQHTVGVDRFTVEKNQKGLPPAFRGSIDEYCVYDRALGPDELAVLAGATK